jgi:hypothetical protein
MSSLILLRSALRRHPFSLGCTALLAALSAALVGAPGPSVGLVCLFWLAASLLGLEAWSRLEP